MQTTLNKKKADSSSITVNHVKDSRINKAYNSFVAGRINQRQYVQIVSAILFHEEIKNGLVKR